MSAVSGGVPTLGVLLHDYEPRSSVDAGPLAKGTEVTLLQRGADFGDFWLVKTSNGKTGYVQANYIRPIAFKESSIRKNMRKNDLRGKITSAYKATSDHTQSWGDPRSPPEKTQSKEPHPPSQPPVEGSLGSTSK